MPYAIIPSPALISIISIGESFLRKTNLDISAVAVKSSAIARDVPVSIDILEAMQTFCILEIIFIIIKNNLNIWAILY